MKLVSAAAIAALVGSLAIGLPAASAAPSIDVPVPGTAAADNSAAQRLGTVAPDTMVSFAVTLPLRHQSQLDRLIAAASDPASPDYGHYLTPGEFAAQYSPTTTQVDTVRGYLQRAGVTVTEVSANRTVIDARGTAQTVAQALGTTLGRYHDPRLDRTYLSNDSRVRLPGAVAPDVLGIVGLDNHYPLQHQPIASAVAPRVGSGPAGGYTPAELKGAYDVTPLASAGNDGTGERVGLFELAAFKQANITTYDNHYGLGSPAPSVVSVDGGTTTLGNAQVEVELDIEVVQAIAPKAAVTVFEAPNSDQGLLDAYNQMATSDTTAANSTSWGLCEAQSSTSTINSEHQIFQQMAAQGQALFAAAGDSGAYDCGTSGQLGVDNPADDPYVTGAGGTHLTLSGTTYSSERPWDTSATEGGGGGVSTVFSKPSWQVGTPTACTKRCVPDISGDADPATGYSIYTQGAWTVVGGTSAAAPLWAGAATVYDQAAVAAGKARLGYANPTLYQLANGSQTYPAFHDVTTGHTSTSTYWPATTGYDMATGIGSVDLNNFARDLIGATAPADDFSIAATPASLSVTPGSSASTTVSTTTTSGSAQSVSFSIAGLPSGASATFSPTTVTSGASSALQILTTTTTPTGTYSVTITGSGTSAVHTTPLSLTVGSGTTGNLVRNPGFETGTAAPWTLSAGVLNNNTVEPAHTGSWDAWFDGYGTTATDTGKQSITIPAGHTTAKLSFYLHIDTDEFGSTAYDKFTVKFGGTVVHRFSNVNASSGYVFHSYNLSGLTPGSTYVLNFTGTEDSSLQTSFVLDDVAVQAT